MNSQQMKSPIAETLFSLFAICHRVESRETFINEIYPIIQQVMPHERFLCGIASVKPLVLLDSINMGFPECYVNDCINVEGKINSPMIRYWLAQDVPVYFTEEFESALLATHDQHWMKKFKQHEMKNMAAHGSKDLHGAATSYFCFAGIPQWDEQTKQVLHMIVPHLHTALRCHFQLKAKTPLQENDLSHREREVLSLVCIGKTNQEIGMILGISPWTVKIHLRNIMAKLDVFTRGHAAAKAIQNKIIDIQLDPIKHVGTGEANDRLGMIL